MTFSFGIQRRIDRASLDLGGKRGRLRMELWPTPTLQGGRTEMMLSQGWENSSGSKVTRKPRESVPEGGRVSTELGHAEV